MTLKEWLFKSRLTITDFANILGMSRPYLGQIVAGTKKPSRWLAKEISGHTYGLVSVDEIMNPDFENVFINPLDLGLKGISPD